MKDIREYLPFYLGTDCQVVYVNDQVTNYMAKVGDVVKFDPITFYVLDSEELINVKLILRPLESMTEEERKELWELIFSQGHGKNFTAGFKKFTGQLRVINEKTHYNVPRLVMMQGVERLCIESDGNVWADCDLHKWRHNQHETTRWMLSKYFDIFNLHTDGICLYRNEKGELY